MSLWDRYKRMWGSWADYIDPGQAYADSAHQMKKYWQQAMGFQSPFMEAGKSQIPMLTGAQNELMNPAALLGKWMDTYETSPYAKRSMENATASGLDAASSMGLMGSSPALSNIQQSSSDIMSKDRDTYLNDLMEKYMKGIGIGTNIFDKGAAMASGLGKQAFDMGENMGSAAYNERAAGAKVFGDWLKTAAKMYGGGIGG